MLELKTKAIRRIEEQLSEMDGESIRAHLLECAKDFKTSWIELGRALHMVRKEQLYRYWGFTTFEAYTAKEIGIQRLTAIKLLRSYQFLEKEEPWYLDREQRQAQQPKYIPHYEAVDVLRVARKKKDLNTDDYAKLRQAVFEDGRSHREVRRSLTSLIHERTEEAPEVSRRKSRKIVIERFVSNLKAATAEMNALKLVPKNLVKQAEQLIHKMEAYL